MIIDTNAIRVAIQVETEKKVAELDRRYPAPWKLPLKDPEKERRAMRAYCRIDDEQAEMCEVLEHVEQMAREYPGGETEEREP